MPIAPATPSPESLEPLSPAEVIDAVLGASDPGGACLTCSFQVEDMIVLDLLRRKIPRIPVLFLDTGYHFAKTYEFRDRMVNEWSLNLVNLQAAQSVASQEAKLGILNRSDPTRCSSRAGEPHSSLPEHRRQSLTAPTSDHCGRPSSALADRLSASPSWFRPERYAPLK